MKNVFALLFCFASFANLFGGAFPSADENASARLAIEARERAPWTMPDEIFRNYVLPDTSVGEARDDWRPLFREKFLPLVRECTTPTAAAETLNREIWKILGVRYSPERDRPDQSPFHSMRIGKASCSGLSILLIDACRAVGVPARFVGCRWKNKPGNHSWVEIWDAGQWHHLGAGDGGNVDSAWFDADAAAATPDDPRFAIYAACAEPTGLSFPLAWIPDGEDSGVPALNVTARYLRFAEKFPRERCASVFLCVPATALASRAKSSCSTRKHGAKSLAEKQKTNASISTTISRSRCARERKFSSRSRPSLPASSRKSTFPRRRRFLRLRKIEKVDLIPALSRETPFAGTHFAFSSKKSKSKKLYPMSHALPAATRYGAKKL